MAKVDYNDLEFQEDEDEEDELPEDDEEIALTETSEADFTPNELIDKLLEEGCEHVMVTGMWMHEKRSGVYGIAVRYNNSPFINDNQKSFRAAYEDFLKEGKK